LAKKKLLFGSILRKKNKEFAYLVNLLPENNHYFGQCFEGRCRLNDHGFYFLVHLSLKRCKS
jgi:hypothetical protein